MNERYIRWWTPHMSRDFEMLVFGDARSLPLVLFPTSFGRYSQNKDFGLIDACAPFIDSGKITIYCPDSADLDGFYNKKIHPADRMRTHNAYERVIVDDVFDFARRECSCYRVAISGASLGAYHAEYRFSFSRRRESSYEPERRIRNQRFLRRLPMMRTYISTAPTNTFRR
jgi:esterase/lipase superfamily enzyme